MLVCSSLKTKAIPLPIHKLVKENTDENAHTVLRSEDVERHYLKQERR